MKTTIESKGVALTPAERQQLDLHIAEVSAITDTIRLVLLGRNTEGTVDVAYTVKPVEPSRRLNLWAVLSEDSFQITRIAPKGYKLT